MHDSAGHMQLDARVGPRKFTVLFMPGKPIHCWKPPISRSGLNRDVIRYLEDGQHCLTSSDPLEQGEWILDHCCNEKQKIQAILRLMWNSRDLRLKMWKIFLEAAKRGPVENELLLECAGLLPYNRHRRHPGRDACGNEQFLERVLESGQIEYYKMRVQGNQQVEDHIKRRGKLLWEEYAVHSVKTVQSFCVPEKWYRTPTTKDLEPQVYMSAIRYQHPKLIVWSNGERMLNLELSRDGSHYYEVIDEKSRWR